MYRVYRNTVSARYHLAGSVSLCVCGSQCCSLFGWTRVGCFVPGKLQVLLEEKPSGELDWCEELL